MFNVARRIAKKARLSFVRSSAVFLFALLLSFVPQYAYSALSVAIDSIAYMSTIEVPGPISAQVRVTANLNNFNNAELTFDQPQLALKEGVSTPLQLTAKNTGVNNLDNTTLVVKFPTDVIPTFAPNPLYTVVQLPDSSWLITFLNPLLPNDVINIDIIVDVVPGAPDTVALIEAELFANGGTAIVSQTLSTLIGRTNDGLFLTHQIDKTSVTSDDIVTYTLTVTNRLPITVRNIILDNVLPIGVRFINRSVKFNGIAVNDPQLSRDGMTAVFDLGTLATNETITIVYSAYISSVARAGELKNISSAKGDIANSNLANAVTLLRKDAINIDSHVVGRVLVDNCSIEEGDSVGKQSLKLSSQLVNDEVLFFVNVEGTGSPINTYRIKTSLPDVIRYIPGSVVIDGEPAKDALLENGYWVINLGAQNNTWEHEISFKAKLDEQAIGLYETSIFAEYGVKNVGLQRTELVSSTYQVQAAEKNYQTLTFWPLFKTLDATLQDADINQLKKMFNGKESIEHITVIGHSDNRVIHGAGTKKFKDNIALSKARAQSIADYLETLLKVDTSKVTVMGKGELEPVADNDTEEGRAKNRRVEILVEMLDEANSRDKHIELGKEKTVEGSLYKKITFVNRKESIESKGLSNIRLMMEDGRFVDTDSEGRYHFEAIKKGTHVIQLDPASIPKDYEAYLCEDNTRFAQTPSSQFIDVQPGLIWRANFHLRKINESNSATTSLKLKSALNKELIQYQLEVNGPAMPNATAKVQIGIPAGIKLLANSVLLNGKAVVAENTNHLWYVALPDTNTAWVNTLTFNAEVATNTTGDYITTAQLLLQQKKDEINRSGVVSNVLTIKPSTTKADDVSVLTQLSKPESTRRVDAIKIEEASDKATDGAVDGAAVIQGIVSLLEGDVLASSAGTVRVNLDSRLQQQLFVDDKLVAESRIGFRAVNHETNQTIYTYFGVRFGEPGEHTLRLKGVDSFGNARFDQSIKYFRSGEIKNIQFVSAENNIADGKTPIVAKLELLDESGKKIAASTSLRIVDGDLQPFTEKGLQKIPLIDSQDKMLEVDKDGVIQFNPVSKSGLYRMKLQYNNIETVVKIYVKPEIRDWVMVGVADGVVGYNQVSGNAEIADSNSLDDQYYDNGKLAFYAKGRVLGKYLLTVAYDSSKENTRDERLLQMIDPNEYYTLYGDETEQQFDAASKKKLYVRLDADKFYALFGDYNTDLSVTELSRYTRSFTGAKVVYESDNISATGFATSTNQAFTRDEILGDGTSGLYYLSKKDIVINSEKITIQVRDRFHSDRIISEQSLSRFADYNFDYSSGTVYFKQPISRHDQDFNPVFIVVDYESYGKGGKEGIIAGGRAAVKLANDNVEIGVTHIDEGVPGAEAKLTGIDARFDITKTLELKTEYATTQVSQLTTLDEADAYLAELLHRGEKVESSVYVREQEAGFGLGQQNQSEQSMRKIGAKTTAMIRKDLEFRGDVGRESNLTNNATRDLLLSNVVYSPDKWEFNLGATIADDKDLNGDSYQSELLNTGIARKLLDDKLRLYTRSDWQLNNGENNLDYPERHIIGSEFSITDDVSIYNEYEYAFSDALKSESTRAGLRTVPWENAAMHNGLQHDTSDAQARTFAVFGLTQAVPFADNWRASFSYDETKTLEKKIYQSVNPNTPLASGTAHSFTSTNGVMDEDFWASTAGVGYQSPLYLFDSRIEYREAETQNKYGVFAGWQRNLVGGIGHALRWQGFITDDKIFGEQLDTQFRYSLVVRPLGSDVFWFNRLELKHMNINGSLNDSKTDKLVEHLAINYVPNIDWQIATHLGYKFARNDLGVTIFNTQTYVLGNETRYNLTPKWDIGGHYHVITTPISGVTQDSYGLSVGVDVVKNLWLSVGYNIDGYYDEDFSANGYTAKGPFLKLRFKFDQDTFNLNE